MQPAFAQAAAYHLRETHQGGFQLLDAGGVFVVGVFMADRLGIGIGADFAVEPAAGVFTAGLPRQRQSPFSEAFFQEGLVKTSEVSDLANAQAVQVLFGDFADAGNFAHVERSQEVRFLSGHDPQHAIGLGAGRRNFRDQAGDADTDRAVEPVSAFIF